ncbi:MAG: sphingosine kinase [Acidimicrobiales bacterium]|nr:sphingosine kinase [Acidimicrobiales bacterium]
MRFEVLVNCGAGSIDEAAADGQLAEISQLLDGAGAAANVRTFDPGDMDAEVRKAAASDPDAVLVAGGDGTVGSAAGAAADAGVVLGVLPLGTFNHFARDLGLPADLAGAAAALATAQPRAVDVGQVGDRVFVNNSVIGAYPAMVDIRDGLREQRGWGKVRAVPVAAFHVLRRFPTHRLTLSTPDGRVRRHVRTPFVFVGNGSYDHEDGRVGERSSMDAGMLCVYVADVVSRWGLLRTVLHALLRGTEAATELESFETSELVITSKSRHLRVAVDGEVVSLEAPLRYRIRPGALQVLAPAPTSD